MFVSLALFHELSVKLVVQRTGAFAAGMEKGSSVVQGIKMFRQGM